MCCQPGAEPLSGDEVLKCFTAWGPAEGPSARAKPGGVLLKGKPLEAPGFTSNLLLFSNSILTHLHFPRMTSQGGVEMPWWGATEGAKPP